MTEETKIEDYTWFSKEHRLVSSFANLGWATGSPFPIQIIIVSKYGKIQFFYDAERYQYKFDKVLSYDRTFSEKQVLTIPKIEVVIYR
jgi:hypothetical protein